MMKVWITISLDRTSFVIINEAKILKKIVVSTNYESASELIGDDNGVITSLNTMHTILYNLINNKDSGYTILNDKVSKYTFNITNDRNKIISIINQ